MSESGFTSHELIELQFTEPLRLEELEYRFIRPLEHMLTLATGARCTAFELHVGNDDGSNDPMATWPATSYTVRRRSTDLDQAGTPLIRQHMRFGMNDASYRPNVDFGEFVPRWYALHSQLSTVCDLIFSSRDDPNGYLQQQVFTIASAIEALHRATNPQLERRTEEDTARNAEVLAAVQNYCPEHQSWVKSAIAYAHRKSYSFRVRALLDETSHLMAEVVGNETKWTQQLRDVRDGIGHVLSSQDDKPVEQMVAMLFSARLFAELAWPYSARLASPWTSADAVWSTTGSWKMCRPT